MKKTLFLIYLVPFLFKAQSSLSKTIVINGQTRAYKIYIPAIYNSNNPVPLVFNFHGYTSNNATQEVYGDFRPIADTANFILVHPQGLDIGGGYGWNSFSNTDPSNYDYIFIDKLITDIQTNYSINPNRIYSTGLSNGGFFSYDLACFMSNRFCAIASVAGSMIASHLNQCNPSVPVPVLQIHGTNDATVSYDGTGGIVASTNIDNLVAFWKNQNSCDQTSNFEALPNINTSDQSTVEHYTYNHITNSGNVELYKVINGGHTWPGSPYPSSVVTNLDFSASKEIWRFFSQHSKPTNTNEIKTISKKGIVIQNPVSTILTLENLQDKELIIFNSIGQKIEGFDISDKQAINIDVSNYTRGLYFIKTNSSFHKVILE